MVDEKTKCELDSIDYEDKFEPNNSVGLRKYSLKEAGKTVKEEFEANDFYEDKKQNLNITKMFKIKNENDNTLHNYNDEKPKPTEYFEVKDSLKPFSIKITHNLVRKIEVAKLSDIEEYEENIDLNCAHSTIVEDSASYASPPLAVELKKKTEKNRYICAHCGYSTIKRSGLIEHLSIHSAERPFACAHCNYRSLRKTTLRKHIKALHLLTSFVNSDDNNTRTSCGQRFRCVSCDVSYTYQYNLKRHIKQHHAKSVNTDVVPTCKICNFSSSNSFIMKNHTLTHSVKSFKCEKCQTSFSRSDVLKQHIFLHHRVEVPYKCKSCDRKFRTEIGLLKHQRSPTTCGGTRKAKAPTLKFKCVVCAKTYAYKSVFDLHMTTHTRQYSFKCTHCAQSFATYTLLRYHIYSHSEESLFKCATCNFTSDHQSSMQAHEEDHQTYSKYKCEHCDYFTKRSNSFKRHKEEHSIKGKFQCAHCSYSTENRLRIVQHLKLHSK